MRRALLPFAPWFRSSYHLGVDDLLVVPFDELRVLFEVLVDGHTFDPDAVSRVWAALTLISKEAVTCG